MRVNDADPGFSPVTITLESAVEAAMLKVLCTTTAKDAVLTKDRLSFSENDLNTFADGLYHELGNRGIRYLSPRD